MSDATCPRSRLLRRLAPCALLSLCWLSRADSALAQYSVPPQAAAASERVGSARAKVREKLVRPAGWELGATLNFLTSEASLGGRDLTFTDLMLLRVHGLASLGGSVELFLGTDLLPKQPSYTNELAWQGVLGGLRVGLGDHFATWLRAQLGPQLGRGGEWLVADVAGQYKLQMVEVLFFEAALGVAHTQLLFDSGGHYLQEELFTQVGIAIRNPRSGSFGAWLNFDYYFPVFDDTAGAASALPDRDPQPRVNFHLGGLIGISPKLDLFIEWTILDRGDLEDPLTTLPILNGGFDQEQIVFGFMRRFGHAEGDR